MSPGGIPPPGLLALGMQDFAAALPRGDLSGLDQDGNGLGGAQGDAIGVPGLAADCGELEVLHESGERDCGLQHREVLTDAGPGAAAEGIPGVPVPRLAVAAEWSL